MKTTKTFNELALDYKNERTEKNFTLLYKELRKIGSIAKNGLTVENDDYESITTDISLRLRDNFDTIHTEHKSIFSYCFVSFKTKYFSLLKKYNKRVYESDMQFGDDDNQFNAFEKLVNDKYNEEEDKEIMLTLHTSQELQVKEFYKIIAELYPDDVEMMTDLFQLRDDEETGNASVFTSPEKIGQKYGIANRTTISARRTRAMQKISEELKKRIEMSRLLDGDEVSGILPFGTGTVDVFKSKLVGYSKTSKNGYKTSSTKVEGGWMEVIFDDKGVKRWEGMKNDKDTRIGIWSFFGETGKLEGRINYDTPSLRYCTFDQSGQGVEMGKLR